MRSYAVKTSRQNNNLYIDVLDTTNEAYPRRVYRYSIVSPLFFYFWWAFMLLVPIFGWAGLAGCSIKNTDYYRPVRSAATGLKLAYKKKRLLDYKEECTIRKQAILEKQLQAIQLVLDELDD